MSLFFIRRRSNFGTLMRIFRETSTAFLSFSANDNILPRPILPKNAEHERRKAHQIMAHAFFTGPNKVNREVPTRCVFTWDANNIEWYRQSKVSYWQWRFSYLSVKLKESLLQSYFPSHLRIWTSIYFDQLTLLLASSYIFYFLNHMVEKKLYRVH